MAALPFAVIGSTQDVVTSDGRKVKGREYSWGVAEVENDEHCDFRKLRSLLIRTHMLDLITTTEENHYENYRQSQMETRKFGDPRYVCMIKGEVPLFVLKFSVCFLALNQMKMLNSRKRKKPCVNDSQNKSKVKSLDSVTGNNR